MGHQQPVTSLAGERLLSARSGPSQMVDVRRFKYAYSIKSGAGGHVIESHSAGLPGPELVHSFR